MPALTAVSAKTLKQVSGECFIVSITIISLWMFATHLSFEPHRNITTVASSTRIENYNTMNLYNATFRTRSSPSSLVNVSDLTLDYDSRDMPFIIASRESKILYCSIPKNGCSIFAWLFKIMETHDPETIDAYKQGENLVKIHQIMDNKLLIYAKSKQERLNTFADYMNDKTWRKLMVIRDPLERLLSGYLNKCVNHNENCFAYKSKVLASDEPLQNKTNSNFSIFVNHLMHGLNDWETYSKENGTYKGAQWHFNLQSTYCNAQTVLDHFTDVIYYDHATIAHDVLSFLQSVDINIDWFLHWGKHQNETMFEAFKTKHTTYKITNGELMDRVNFYGQYYDKQLANDVIDFYAKDYKLFNMKPPKWVDLL